MGEIHPTQMNSRGYSTATRGGSCPKRAPAGLARGPPAYETYCSAVSTVTPMVTCTLTLSSLAPCHRGAYHHYHLLISSHHVSSPRPWPRRYRPPRRVARPGLSLERPPIRPVFRAHTRSPPRSSGARTLTQRCWDTQPSQTALQ